MEEEHWTTWAGYLAVDPDGTTAAFEHRPRLYDGRQWCNPDGRNVELDYGDEFPNVGSPVLFRLKRVEGGDGNAGN